MNPAMTGLEIIRNANTSDQTIEEAPGVMEVKRSLEKPRGFKFSKFVCSKGSGGTPPDPYFAIFDPDLFQASPNEVTYSVTLKQVCRI